MHLPPSSSGCSLAHTLAIHCCQGYLICALIQVMYHQHTWLDMDLCGPRFDPCVPVATAPATVCRDNWQARQGCGPQRLMFQPPCEAVFACLIAHACAMYAVSMACSLLTMASHCDVVTTSAGLAGRYLLCSLAIGPMRGQSTSLVTECCC